ncbi:bifunctional serine/threonine-protein kinase/ABC transporter substrate-binding protein [Streptomyces populi]
MTEQNSELIAGRYRLVERIGQGGMGQVWRGLDQQLFGREVAIKEILFPPGMGEDDRATLLRRFTAEAQAAVILSHPGIITIHDVVEHNGAPMIVMELVRGRSLAAVIRQEGRLPARRVAEIGAALLDALAEAHEARIVHRDIKPDNVLLSKDRVVLTDFGIAHLADATTKLSHSGIVIGTPQYMSPEQLEGKRPTPANDLWALGATLYHAVEGQSPFAAEGLHALAVAVFTRPYRPPVHAGPLAPVLEALLTKDPEQRVSTTEAAAMLAAALRSLPAREEAAAEQEPGPGPEGGPSPDAATERAPLPVPPKPSKPPKPSEPRGQREPRESRGQHVPHEPTLLDSGAPPADTPRPVPERPADPPRIPAPVPPAEDPISPGTTDKAKTGEQDPVRKHAPTRRSVVLGTALATLAAGSVLTWTLSGEDGTPGGGTGGTASGNGAAAPAATVVIGVDAPLTGAVSPTGVGIRNSADLAVRTANEKEYVPGVKFEIKALDDAYDPAKGKQNAARFVSDAKVLGVVGPLDSPTARTLVPPLAEADLVNVSAGNTYPELTLGPDWAAGTKSRPYATYFRTLASDLDQGPFAARYLYTEAKKNKVYVLRNRDDLGTALASGFTAEFEKRGGTVVGTKEIPFGQSDFSDVVEEVRASGADAVYYSGYATAGGRISKQLKQAGVTVPLMGSSSLFVTDFLKTNPKAEGDLAVDIGMPAENQAGGADFLARYRKAGYEDKDAGYWYGPYAYDATWSLIEAVKSLVKANGGTLPPDARAKMSQAMSRLDFEGVTGRVAFDEYGDTRNRRLTVCVVKGGRWTTVATGTAHS